MVNPWLGYMSSAGNVHPVGYSNEVLEAYAAIPLCEQDEK